MVYLNRRHSEESTVQARSQSKNMVDARVDRMDLVRAILFSVREKWLITSYIDRSHGDGIAECTR